MTPGTIIESNDSVLAIILRVIEQNQAIIDANVKLLETLGHPIVVTKFEEMLP